MPIWPYGPGVLTSAMDLTARKASAPSLRSGERIDTPALMSRGGISNGPQVEAASSNCAHEVLGIKPANFDVRCRHLFTKALTSSTVDGPLERHASKRRLGNDLPVARPVASVAGQEAADRCPVGIIRSRFVPQPCQGHGRKAPPARHSSHAARTPFRFRIVGFGVKSFLVSLLLACCCPPPCALIS